MYQQFRPLFLIILAAGVVSAQEGASSPSASHPFTVTSGTKVPLALINTVSTRHSAEGDRVYLETVFPVLVNGRIVVPVGSWVTGRGTPDKKEGGGKGRGGR